jgi:hypothetical protein
MENLKLYREMESLNSLRALVDEANCGSWIAESRKWSERAELEIESYLWERYEVPETSVNYGSSLSRSDGD